MDDVTRRKAIKLAATTGVVAGGIIAAGSSEAEAQQENRKKEATSRIPREMVALRPGERVFEGESADDKLQAALEAALQKLDKALPEGNVSDASASWRLLDVAGQRGGITGRRVIKVRIAATRQPPWPNRIVTRAGSGGSDRPEAAGAVEVFNRHRRTTGRRSPFRASTACRGSAGGVVSCAAGLDQ